MNLELERALNELAGQVADDLEETDADIVARDANLPARHRVAGVERGKVWLTLLSTARRRRRLRETLTHLCDHRKDNHVLRALVDRVLDTVATLDDPGGILVTGTTPLSEPFAPSQLLDARYEVVPWHKHGREEALRALDAWADEDAPSSVRLLHAEGGIGKTRLAIEWTRQRRRDAGWCAGFLPRELPDSWADDLCACGVPVLVVVDYAESRHDLTSVLTTLREAHARRGEAKLRVLLLARNDGDWFATLRLSSELVGWLSKDDTRELDPVAKMSADRDGVFAESAKAFAKRLGRVVVAPPPEELARKLVDERFNRVLYLHMAALATVEGLAFDAGNLMDTILDHEEHFWAKRAREEDDLDVSARTKDARQVVAAATLRAGLTTNREARELLKHLSDRVLDREDDKLLMLLHRVYMRSGEVVWLPGLEPDLLGEAMVVRVASPEADEHHVDDDWIDRVFPADEPDALRVGFTVLGRASATAPEVVRPWITRMLRAGALDVRAPAALEAAKVTGRRTAFSVLGYALAEQLKTRGDVSLAVALERVGVPRHTVSLREVAAWVEQTGHRALGSADVEAAERARRANNLGVRLSELGQREEALTVTREAVAEYRTLATRNPDAFLPDLAMSLNNLGIRLSELGQREEALTATREAVTEYRTLATRNPDAFLPNLATSLNNLGAMCSNLGQREEALTVTREAVAEYRTLATRNPDVFLPNLATSLNNLGIRLSELGQREEALTVTREAVAEYRTLATRNPDAFLPNLATSLTNLGARLSELGQREEALAPVSESFDLYWRFFEHLPAAFAQNTGIVLRHLIELHQSLGRALPEEITACAEEFARRTGTSHYEAPLLPPDAPVTAIARRDPRSRRRPVS